MTSHLDLKIHISFQPKIRSKKKHDLNSYSTMGKKSKNIRSGRRLQDDRATVASTVDMMHDGEEADDASNGMTQDGNEAYRAFMDKLAKSDVDNYVDLPMIAVMGDTSSGKSSLLSMISQVELPSNEKLTTRCPIMLQMRNTSTKSAVVKINWKDKPDATAVKFPGKVVDENNWNELTGYIADAQDHIVKSQNKEVARDIVSVEMTGPHCENLTLIDLPGIVRSHGKDESASLSDDIQSLLTDYLKNPRCVILAVLPANVDFHNSQIMAEALKVDPETKRTIPVLTLSLI